MAEADNNKEAQAAPVAETAEEAPKKKRGGQPGNSGGKEGRSGRKSKFDEDELLDLLDKNWPQTQRAAAIKKVAARAALGDLGAFQLLMAYAYGKPKEKHEHTGADGKDLIPILNVTLNARPEAAAETDDSVSKSGD